jgi:hypothetical protein
VRRAHQRSARSTGSAASNDHYLIRDLKRTHRQIEGLLAITQSSITPFVDIPWVAVDGSLGKSFFTAAPSS